MKLKGAYSFFTEDDILSIAKQNSILDDALCHAIKSCIKDGVLKEKDLSILQQILNSKANQSQIAKENDVSRMAISKRMAKIRSLLGPYVEEYIKRELNVGEAPTK